MHTSEFTSPVVIGEKVTGVSRGVTDGKSYVTEWSGVYQGVHDSEWETGTKEHFFAPGIIGETPQGCFAIPVRQFSEPEPEMTAEESALHDQAYASADDCDTCWYLCSDQKEIPHAQVMIKLREHFASGHRTTSDWWTWQNGAVIREAHGNLLASGADALVNTVNTAGVMGKGIALQFKQAYPGNFRAYAAACRRGDIVPGRMFVWETGQMGSPRFIVNFPTKRHWRDGSRIGDIRDGLLDLAKVIGEYGVTSIAIPPLGCGLGGLRWEDVQPLIVAALGDLDAEIMLYASGDLYWERIGG